jgi:uncharacterized membrane protein (DUF4010 family)
MMTGDLAGDALNIAAAALGGLAVGIERQWSGHATGPHPRFAGMRTFTLLGGLSGVAGWLWTQEMHVPAAVLLATTGALVIVAYAAASRHGVEATTEVAGLVVLAAGFLAGLGALALASAVTATAVMILVEKSHLHALVQRLNSEEVSAGARFAVMAVVVLPLLPPGPYGPLGGIRPRQLWALVLLFSGISFAGYIARRAVGAQHGYPVAGLLGGLVSSTQVTLTFARTSRSEQKMGAALACGAVAASTVLFVRTLFAASILEPALAYALLPYAGPAFAVGVVATIVTLRRAPAAPPGTDEPRNPLQFRSAVQMALLFQVVLAAVFVIRERLGTAGLLASGAVVGLTDVDAVTVSMARSVAEGVAAIVGAQAIAAGMLSNTLLKLGLAVVIGRGVFRVVTAVGLAAVAGALGVTLVIWR